MVTTTVQIARPKTVGARDRTPGVSDPSDSVSSPRREEVERRLDLEASVDRVAAGGTWGVKGPAVGLCDKAKTCLVGVRGTVDCESLVTGSSKRAKWAFCLVRREKGY